MKRFRAGSTAALAVVAWASVACVHVRVQRRSVGNTPPVELLVREWWTAIAARDTVRLEALSAVGFEEAGDAAHRGNLDALLTTTLGQRATVERWNLEDMRVQHTEAHALATYRWHVTLWLRDLATRTNVRGSARDSLALRGGRWVIRVHHLLVEP